MPFAQVYNLWLTLYSIRKRKRNKREKDKRLANSGLVNADQNYTPVKRITFGVLSLCHKEYNAIVGKPTKLVPDQ